MGYHFDKYLQESELRSAIEALADGKFVFMYQVGAEYFLVSKD